MPEERTDQTLVLGNGLQLRVDPGAALVLALSDDGPALRARALRSAGELGRRDLFRECVAHLREKEPACRFWAARSPALLGER